MALERGHDVIEASVIASEATDEDLIAISRRCHEEVAAGIAE